MSRGRAGQEGGVQEAEAPTPSDHASGPGALLGAVYADGVDERREHVLRWADGSASPLHVHRWSAEATAAELALLARARAPVIDVGCGPGRLVAALSRAGVTALGIDVLPEAVARGASAERRSVFGRVPGAGAWGTAILLDGNVGIGGDPVALLRRVHELLDDERGGTVLLETEPEGVGVRSGRCRLETPTGTSTAFRWGRVGADGLAPLAAATGFAVADAWQAGDRHFAELTTR